jgi:RNase adaptor protein for sRNA GlmZ degradation
VKHCIRIKFLALCIFRSVEYIIVQHTCYGKVRLRKFSNNRTFIYPLATGHQVFHPIQENIFAIYILKNIINNITTDNDTTQLTTSELSSHVVAFHKHRHPRKAYQHIYNFSFTHFPVVPIWKIGPRSRFL